MKKRIAFIVNPISGIGKQKKIDRIIERNLDHDLFDYEIRYTEYVHHGTALARQIVEEGGIDAVIAVGGDGSVNDVATGLKDSGVTMGIIPCGSGNGLARNLRIPLTPALAIKVINQYHVAPIDTVSVNDRIFVSIAGVGFDAQVARRMKLAKTRGLQAYANIVLTDYPTSEEKTYRMRIDGKSVVRKAWFISFANSNQFGYNTAVAPLAKLDDGLIDVCIVGKIPLHHLTLTAPLLYTNHFQYSQHVEIYKAKEVELYNNENQWINLDGEGERIGTQLTFVNHPKSLNIICRPPQVKPTPKTVAKQLLVDIDHDILRPMREEVKKVLDI